MSDKHTTYKRVLPYEYNIKVIDQFGFLPLSVIEPTKKGKSKWKEIAYLNDGIEEKRRPDDVEYLPGLKFSEFHAELAEMIINYWSLTGSVVVDPFAGRATRAVISSILKRKYHGYEISKTTVDRVNEHLQKNNIVGASIYNEDGTLLEKTNNDSADLVFTCPPYHSLEKYESCEGQLSDVKSYDDFLVKINTTIKNVGRVLKPGAFCIWVCGDWREGGEFKSFSSDSINLFKNNGIRHYDTMIIKNISPFATFQLDKCAAKRYSSKIHEYILVFKKPGEYDFSWYSPDTIKNKFFNS